MRGPLPCRPNRPGSWPPDPRQVGSRTPSGELIGPAVPSTTITRGLTAHGARRSGCGWLGLRFEQGDDPVQFGVGLSLLNQDVVHLVFVDPEAVGPSVLPEDDPLGGELPPGVLELLLGQVVLLG